MIFLEALAVETYKDIIPSFFFLIGQTKRVRIKNSSGAGEFDLWVKLKYQMCLAFLNDVFPNYIATRE